MSQWSRRAVRRKKKTVNFNWNGLYRWLWVLPLPIILAGVYWFCMEMSNAQLFPIQSIEVRTQNSPLDSLFLKKQLRQKLTGSFFDFNAKELIQFLQSYSWVDKISMRRVWPNRLIVVVNGRHPVARWGNYFVSENAEVFALPPNVKISRLPIFIGEASTLKKMLTQYQTLNNEIKSLGIAINKIYLNKNDSWQTELSNGIIVILGRSDIPQRWRLFIRLYPRLSSNADKKIQYIDLRYSNGLAVKWIEP